MGWLLKTFVNGFEIKMPFSSYFQLYKKIKMISKSPNQIADLEGAFGKIFEISLFLGLPCSILLYILLYKLVVVVVLYIKAISF